MQEPLRIEQDLVYSTEHERCLLDIYHPDPANGTVVVWFHGGGLVEGDKTKEADLALLLSAHAVTTVMANYRFSGPATFPSYIQDAANALAWVQKELPARGIPVKRLVVGGMSAGAYMAALVVLDPQYLTAVGLDPGSIDSLIVTSGQLSTHFQVKAERGMPGARVISDEASPMFFIRKEMLPMLLLVADNDIPCRLEEYQLFAASLKQAGGTEFTFQVLADREHGTIFADLLLPNNPVALLIVKFLENRALPAKK